MRSFVFNENADRALKQLSEKGAFLTVSSDGCVNVMTIGWGSVGFIWGKPVFSVLVKTTRFTHELLDKSAEFSVSIPYRGMKEALALCGSKSGRDMEKLEAAGLTTRPGRKTGVPVINCPAFNYECRVLYKHTVAPAALALAAKPWYADGSTHTVFMGEIVACYVTD